MNRDLKLLLLHLGRFKRRYAFGALFLACSDVGQLAIPQMVGQVIDGIGAHRLDAAGVRQYALWIVLAALFVACVRYGWRMFVFGTARIVESELRQGLFDHLQALDARFFLQRKIGDLMAHATNDVSAVRGAAGEGFMSGFDAIFMAVGTTIMMVWQVNGRLAVCALAPLLLLPPLSFKVGQAIHVRYTKVQEAFSELSDRVQENVAGIRVVKGFVRERFQAERFGVINERYRKAFSEMARFDVAFDPMINTLSGAAFAIGLGYGGYLVVAGQLTVGQYVAFNSFLAMLVWPMLALGWVMNILQRSLVSMGRLQAIFDARPEVVDQPEAQALPAPQGALELRDLTFRYAPELPAALTNLNLTLAPGKTVGILGKTGAGKSTLANLLVRVFDPPRGTVFLDGHDVLDLKLADLRRAIAYVPQDSFLFSRTIRDNAAFEPRPHPDDEVYAASRLAQLHDDVDGFSLGYATMLGERGITLSGGQRQRLSIARALLKDARVLVLDDCLSAVDTVTESKILAGLRPYAADRTTIVISHRISALQHADEILVLEGGRVIERGTHAGLIAQKGEYARLYRKQQLEAAIEGM